MRIRAPFIKYNMDNFPFLFIIRRGPRKTHAHYTWTTSSYFDTHSHTQKGYFFCFYGNVCSQQRQGMLYMLPLRHSVFVCFWYILYALHKFYIAFCAWNVYHKINDVCDTHFADVPFKNMSVACSSKNVVLIRIYNDTKKNLDDLYAEEEHTYKNLFLYMFVYLKWNKNNNAHITYMGDRNFIALFFTTGCQICIILIRKSSFFFRLCVVCVLKMQIYFIDIFIYLRL